jgi:two-component system response regulator PilR (NtrC family)
MNECAVQSSPKKILLVEDESVIRCLFDRILHSPHYRLTSSGSVTAGIASIEEGTFDLLISDLRLPDGCGTEVIRRFKEKFPEVPVLVVTGSLTPEERMAQVAGLGVHACVHKPFEVQKMQETIDQVLEMPFHG